MATVATAIADIGRGWGVILEAGHETRGTWGPDISENHSLIVTQGMYFHNIMLIEVGEVGSFWFV